MKRKLISTAVLLAMLPATGAFAAALDRSGQPVSPLFQPGNLVEFGYTWISPSVAGVENAGQKRAIPDMGSSYKFPNAAIKYQANEKLSFALLYDHPFGAAAAYSGVNNFTTTPQAYGTEAKALAGQQALATATAKATQQLAGMGMNQAQIDAMLPTVLASPDVQAQMAAGAAAGAAALTPQPAGSHNTNVTVNTQSFSLLAAYQPNDNWTVYGGPVYQTIKGDVHLRGAAYSLFNGYDANFETTGGWGVLAGAAYEIPDIAFRAAMTYRSAISHDVDTKENFVNFPGAPVNGTTKIETPQSINLDVQSGIAPNTLAFANLRWVDWSGFAIRPGQFGAVSKTVGPAVGKPNGFDLVSYDKDQYSATVGVGRKFNDKWAGNVSLGWDSGTGEYVTTLGPVDGNWNIGAGVQYSPTKNFYVGVGAKYLWLGDAKAQVSSKTGTPNYDGDFSGNDAVAVGVKVGYRF